MNGNRKPIKNARMELNKANGKPKHTQSKTTFSVDIHQTGGMRSLLCGQL